MGTACLERVLAYLVDCNWETYDSSLLALSFPNSIPEKKNVIYKIERKKKKHLRGGVRTLHSLQVSPTIKPRKGAFEPPLRSKPPFFCTREEMSTVCLYISPHFLFLTINAKKKGNTYSVLSSANHGPSRNLSYLVWPSKTRTAYHPIFRTPDTASLRSG